MSLKEYAAPLATIILICDVGITMGDVRSVTGYFSLILIRLTNLLAPFCAHKNAPKLCRLLGVTLSCVMQHTCYIHAMIHWLVQKQNKRADNLAFYDIFQHTSINCFQ